MEESEKRREKLMALRAEASAEGTSAIAAHPLPPGQPSPPPPPPPAFDLPNPLLGSASPAASPTGGSNRFSFYTDPTSAISGAKRKVPSSNLGTPAACPQSPRLAVSPQPIMNQMPNNSGSPYQAPLPHPPPGLLGTPYRGPESSGSSGRGFVRSPAYGGFSGPRYPWGAGRGSPYTPNFSIGHSQAGQEGGWPGSGHSVQSGSPRSFSPAWNTSADSSGHCFPPYLSRDGGFGSPCFGGAGRGGSPGGWGRGSPQSGAPGNYGRGRGWHNGGRSPSPGFGGGRGGRFSSRCGGDPWHIKCMTKDPWRKLKPVVGSILGPRASGSGQHWLTKSPSTTKKPDAAEGTPRSAASGSKQSLAEFLALSYEESINEAAAADAAASSEGMT